MKQISAPIIILCSTLVLVSCGSSTAVAPSQNSALNSVSPSGKEKKGYIQTSLDTWLEEEWTPAVEKDGEIQKKYMKKSEIISADENSSEIKYVEKEDKTFTLQELADKSEAYLRAHDTNDTNSHIDKLESLPVIGK